MGQTSFPPSAILTAGVPTSEPVASGVWWLNSGVLTFSQGIPPTIDTQPQAASADEGETATFTVVATNATSYQWQLDSGGGFANISGATSTSYTTAALTTDEDGDEYRCVVSGPGGSTTTDSAVLTVQLPAILDGVPATVAISPQYLVTQWRSDSRATVNVEKGYGSAVFQDLYPHTDGNLYTEPNGAGTEASVWAAGAKLLVETPYNQTLASEVASGHPTAITDASRRVLLDVSVSGSPAFAGISQGTQDASQHASERGYETNVSITSDAGFNVLTFDQGVGSTNYKPFNNSGGSSQGLLVDASANQRWYDNAVAVVNKINPTTRPNVKGWFINRLDRSPTTATMVGMQGGAKQGGGQFSVNATSTPINIWGATSPLNGRAFAFVIWTGETDFSTVSTVTRGLHVAAKDHFAASELSLYSPKINQGYSMDLAANTGTIYIECASGPSREIEASFNGSAYQSIGTTDSNGYLAGSFTGASPGRGTLNVRVVGQVTVGASVSNVSVGVFVAALGQSNALGRGDDYTFSPVVGSRQNAGDWSTLPTTDKSWLAKFAKDLATAESAPLTYHNSALGASYLYFNSGGSTDGRHGHWSPTNPGSTNTNGYADSVRNAMVWYGDPNFIVWHQGESEAGTPVDAATYEAALIAFWTAYQADTGITSKLWIMQIGRDGNVADANVDAIREAQVNAVANRPDLFELGGCLAHLPVEDTLDSGQNVHFYTTAQKDSVAAVFHRHALGSGRGPQFGSMVASGTTITVTCTGGVSPLTIDSGEESSPIGWTVTDDNGARTISAVSVSGLVITLTVDQALVGDVTTKWLSHYSGVGTTLLDSDATTPVPPEPFSETVAAS